MEAAKILLVFFAVSNYILHAIRPFFSDSGKCQSRYKNINGKKKQAPAVLTFY
jgi:hypothetical protein